MRDYEIAQETDRDYQRLLQTMGDYERAQETDRD